jgi:aspartyl-tRNA(Asn)/glutamyl-tRNA(Gln) amidotransferase subunit C
MPEPLSIADARAIARLARLDLSEDQLETHRHHLGAILGHMDHLRTLDLSTVEPLSSPLEITNRLAIDEPGPMLSNGALMALAPPGAAAPPFIKVPKVLTKGDGGA